MSAFSTVVGRLAELSESELHQLHSIVGIRLGIRDGSSNRRGAGSNPNKVGRGKGSNPKPLGSRKASSKGNPSRKSQWETHPLYNEYKRLKKSVETQAKEKNLSFAAVDTPEREAYNVALSQWLEAKSSFRDHSGDKKEGGKQGLSDKGKGRARAHPATEAVAGPSSSGKTRTTTWASEAEEVERGGASSSEEDEELPDVPDIPVEPISPPTVDFRETRISPLGAPPKRGGRSTRK